LRIVYMGTPQIAATILEAILKYCEKEPSMEVVGVFTQPDKPVGRKQVMTPSEVKVLAQSAGIPVFAPRRIKKPVPVEHLKELAPDLVLVCAYGQILSKEILDIPALGCINFHTSLLPKYRGAAPIQWAIANGETVTGVTAMRMDEGMDTGDILLQRELPIDPADTAESLTDKLATLSAGLAEEILKRLKNGEELKRTPQDASEATYAPILQKEDGKMDFASSAASLADHCRGFYPWPGTYCYQEDGKKLTVLECKALSASVPEDTAETAAAKISTEELAAGTLVPSFLEGKHPRMVVTTGDGLLEILRLKPEGKGEMAAEAYLRGLRNLKEIKHVLV